MDTLVLSLTILLWIDLFFVHAIDFGQSKLSFYELSRRVKTGDSQAKASLKRLTLRQRLQTLQWLIELIELVILVSLMIYLLGIWLGPLLSLVIAAQLNWISSKTFVSQLTDKLTKGINDSLLNLVSNWRWLDFLSTKPRQENYKLGSNEELLHLVDQAKDIFTSSERTSLAAMLQFSDKQVKDIMQSRKKIKSVTAHDKVGPLVIDELHKTGHSQFPVCDSSLDQVVGVLSLTDLVNLKAGHKTVKSAMTSNVYYLNQSQSLQAALTAFLRTKASLFIVVDTEQKTVGLLTLQDLVQQLLGYQPMSKFNDYDNLRKVAAKSDL